MRHERKTVGEGEYNVMSHQEFVNRDGQLVRITRENPTQPTPIGVAYGFFDSDASTEEIESVFPKIRDIYSIPDRTEFNLRTGVESLTEDPAYKTLLTDKRSDRRYIVQAKLPGGTNGQTADELVQLLNGVYAADLSLNRANIAHREGDQYVFRE